jgi:glycosyltransferase involved in cell wall biosynthesis
MPFLRKWDVKTAGRVNYYVSNSEHVKNRINRYYKMDAEVNYPPVDIENYNPGRQQKRENFLLAVSELTEYKKIDFLVDVFNDMPDEKLVVIGDGPMMDKLKKQAMGNII